MIRPVTEDALRRDIVRVCRALSGRFLVAATDGNVSAKLPSGRLLITPSGVSKERVREEDLIVCDSTGRRVRGDGAVTTEVLLHAAAYRERPDAGAAVHAHPVTASAFTYAGEERWLAEPIVPDVAARIGSVPSAPYFTPGSRELADAGAALLRGCDVVLLSRHGAVSVGRDPWAAFLRMEKLEQLALIVKAARELAGSDEAVRRLTPEQVADLRRTYSP